MAVMKSREHYGDTHFGSTFSIPAMTSELMKDLPNICKGLPLPIAERRAKKHVKNYMMGRYDGDLAVMYDSDYERCMGGRNE